MEFRTLSGVSKQPNNRANEARNETDDSESPNPVLKDLTGIQLSTVGSVHSSHGTGNENKSTISVNSLKETDENVEQDNVS